MFVKTRHFTEQELATFLELQQLSYSILEGMRSDLTGGETEKVVANELVRRYRKAGADSFFHLPVALFGDRAALPGNWTIGHFFPKSKQLKDGDSVILDASPLFKGYMVDTSYSFCFGEDEAHKEMMLHLAQYRSSIPDAINSGASFQNVAEQVVSTMDKAGYESVHRKHPGEVLGHRAIKTPKLPFQLRLQGFDAISLTWFRMKEAIAGTPLTNKSPLWNTSELSDHEAHDGLWLVEPHAGRGEVGAKWEEILVIENGSARWLEQAPPHVKQIEKIRQGEPY